jgi:TrmH RNA methyltransferase
VARASHEKVYGLAAATAAFEARPDDVMRIAHTKGVRGELREVLREAARRRIAYEERSEEDVAKIAGSVHHEGVCFALRPRAVGTPEMLIERLARGPWRCAVALDDVENPHNVGAIVRTAAFFGADAVLVAPPADRAPLAPAAVRVAQGGAEHVAVARAASMAEALSAIARAGIAVIGTDVRTERALASLAWPPRCVVVLGSEAEGISPDVRRACTDLVAIRGSGRVESLNVSVAAGVLLASWAGGRQR